MTRAVQKTKDSEITDQDSLLLKSSTRKYSDAENNLSLSLAYTKEAKKTFRVKREHLSSLLHEKREELAHIIKGIEGLEQRSTPVTDSDVINKRIGKRKTKLNLLLDDIDCLETARQRVQAILKHLIKTPSQLNKAVKLARKLVRDFDDSDDDDEGPIAY